MRTSLLLIMIGLISLTNCGEKTPTPLGTIQGLPENQQILCEITTINFAWNRIYKGTVIDAGGQIWSYSFDRSDPLWMPADPDSIRLDELLEKYDHNLKLVGEVDGATLCEIYGLLHGADIGPISEPQHICFDFGSVKFVAYLMDEESELYHPILVRQMGDMARKNFSGDAEYLYQVMARAVGWDYRDAPCDYQE